MWRRENVAVLITKYQDFENLYNCKHPHYQDRVKRSDSLFKIYEVLKEKNEKITVEAIKAKIHTLRSQYMKELREIKASKKSGIGAEDVYTPKLWCFDQLEFLKPYVQTRKSTSSMSGISEDHVLSNSASNSMQSSKAAEFSEEPGPSKKSKKSTKFDDKLKNVRDLFADKLSKKINYVWLGKQVVFDINSIQNEDIRGDTVWKIQSCLREAKLADRRIRNSPQDDPICIEFFSDESNTSFRPISSSE